MVFVASVVLASSDDHDAASVRLGRCPRHASAYGCSWNNFLTFSLALFALGKGRAAHEREWPTPSPRQKGQPRPEGPTPTARRKGQPSL